MDQTGQTLEHSMRQFDREGRSDVSDFLRRGRKVAQEEKVSAWLADNPGAPPQEDYNYALMFEQNKMPEAGGEGFTFLHEDGYKNPRTRYVNGIPMPSLMAYEINSKTNQIEHGGLRTLAMGLKNSVSNLYAQTGIPQIKGDLVTRAVVAKKNAQADDNGQLPDPIDQEGQADIYDQVLESMKENEFDAISPTISGLQSNRDGTLRATFEEFGTILTEFGLDVLGSKATIGKKSGVDMSKAKSVMQKLARRMEEATSPAMVGGETLFAANEEHPETASAMLGEQLTEMGYSGPIIDFMLTTDDTPQSRMVANIVEGAMMFEFGRSFLRAGYKVPAWLWKGAAKRIEFAKTLEYKTQMPGMPGSQRGEIGWHGSGADNIEETGFDHKFMGTGEGAQAYGHGTYIGGRQSTGEYYQKDLTRHMLEFDGVSIKAVGATAKVLREKFPDLSEDEALTLNGIITQAFSDPQMKGIEGVKEAAQGQVEMYATVPKDSEGSKWAQKYVASNQRIIDFLEKYEGKIGDAKGHLYKVEIDDSLIPKMLDWDKPLSEQGDILKKLEGVTLDASNSGGLTKYKIDQFNAGNYDQVGAREIMEALGKGDYESVEASRALNELGIPGIKYSDGYTRASQKAARQNQGFIKPLKDAVAGKEEPEGTSNYVMFNPDDAKIVGKNGEPVVKKLQDDASAKYAEAKKTKSLPDHPEYTPKGERITIPDKQTVLPGPTSKRKGASNPQFNNKLVSAINLTRPLNEMEQRIERVSKGQAAPEVIITPEDLKGQNIMFVYGDKTVGDAQVIMVDGKKLRKPVDAEGGRIFMRVNTGEGYIWSSETGIISRHMNAAKRAMDENGQPVNIIYTSMAMTGMDFSHMPTDVHLQRILDAKLSRNAVKEYDEHMASKVPGWVGIKSPDIDAFINKSSAWRKLFLQASDMKNVASIKGMPDVGSSRLAVTDPRLLQTPLDHGGLGISRIDLSMPTREGAHKTYKTDMPGQYLGDLVNSVPFDVLFPNSYAYFRKAYPTSRVDYMAGRKSLTEVADDAWVNRVSEYLMNLEKMK